MSDTVVVNIVQTINQLSEIEAADSLVESTTSGNVIKELSARCKLKSDANNWVFCSILLFNKCLSGKINHVDNVGMTQVLHGVDFGHD